ncbi:MAG: hypothetical protein BRD40_02415, partial [Bacteroidetes bacterium QS_1_65_9]
ARSTLDDLLVDEGYSGSEVLEEILDVARSRYAGEQLADLHRLAGEIDVDLHEGTNDRLHLSHLLLIAAQLIGVQHRVDKLQMVGRLAGVVALQNGHFFVQLRVIHVDLEQKAVQLRFRQAVGAFMLQRVLRGDHQERLRHRVRLAVSADLPLLHHLEECGLRLGDAGHAFDQHVAARQERREQQVQHLALPDQDFVQLAAHVLHRLLKLREVEAFFRHRRLVVC